MSLGLGLGFCWGQRPPGWVWLWGRCHAKFRSWWAGRGSFWGVAGGGRGDPRGGGHARAGRGTLEIGRCCCWLSPGGCRIVAGTANGGGGLPSWAGPPPQGIFLALSSTGWRMRSRLGSWWGTGPTPECLQAPRPLGGGVAARGECRFLGRGAACVWERPSGAPGESGPRDGHPTHLFWRESGSA